MGATVNGADSERPLGLIAGEGIFPILVARGARAAGRRVVCAALADSASPLLRGECDEFKTVGILRIGQWLRFLRRAGCSEAIMVGRVEKTRMYRRFRYFRYVPDWRTVRLWMTKLRHDRRPYAVLKGVTEELALGGITLIDSTRYTADHLATAGVMTRRQPDAAQWIDARFGFGLCKSISGLDIGQSIAVLRRDVIAVEAVEGTNAMIDRAGALCRSGGWTLIKVGNSAGDMRSDVPTVGVTTIERLAVARCACVVMEVGTTVLLEKPKVIELADRHGIAIVGCTSEEIGEERKA
jgi:UDP-2,3-diacylglucosamine hydrolase